MAASASAARSSSGQSRTARSSPGRGWQTLQHGFKDFLVHRPPNTEISAASAVAAFLGIMDQDDGSAALREKLREADQDRLLENIIAHLDKDSADGKLAEQRWGKARDAFAQIRDGCKSLGYKAASTESEQSGGYGSLNEFLGVKGTADAAASVFPGDWCRLVTEELIADLAVDAIMGPMVDAFVDGAVELLTVHEGWTLPNIDCVASPHSRPWGRSSSSPTLRQTHFSTELELIDESMGSSVTQSIQLPGGHQQSQSPRLQRPGLPPVWPNDALSSSPHRVPSKQQKQYQSLSPKDGLSPSHSSGYSPYHQSSTGFATRPGRYSVRGGRGSGNNGDGWNLRQFYACKTLDPCLKRIQTETERQRPRQRLRRALTDPLGPKYSLPMLATNFPAVWEKTAPLKMKPAEDAAAPPAAVDEDEEWEEEEPKGYTWLQRKGRDGKTLFPYSLVSHKAFIESQPNPLLKAKVLEIAPMRLTDSW